jgi:hypothetical protein
MVFVLGAQTSKVSLPETGFTCVTDFIFVQHSGTNTGQLCKIRFRSQRDTVKVNCIRESTYRDIFCRFFSLVAMFSRCDF